MSVYIFIEKAISYVHVHVYFHVRNKARGQSDSAKAASNAPHTVHAQDSLALAVPKICMESQKLKVGHVTPLPTTYDLVLHSFR